LRTTAGMSGSQRDRARQPDEGAPERARHWWSWVAASLGATVLAYLPLLGRGFQSEDFLLLRWLGDSPPWRAPWAGFGEPWLGISAVSFYRPLSTTVLALERAAFGGSVLPYDLVHLAVHLVNVLAVGGIARRLGVTTLGAGVAMCCFGLYPLSADAVAFIASFATLIGTGCALAVAWLFLDPRPTRLSWGGFGLAAAGAFASYESAAVLPCLLLLAALTASPSPSVGRQRWVAWGASGAMALAYFALRQALFGALLGGYDETAATLSAARLQELAGRAVACAARLTWPLSFGAPQVVRDLAIALAFVTSCVLPAWWGRRDARLSRRRVLQVAVIAILAVFAALAPFAFQPLVPGIGRYAYLATVPLALALGGVVHATSGAPRFKRWALAGLAPWGVAWAVALFQGVGAHRAAKDLAATVTSSLASTVAERGDGGPCFVEGTPWFVRRRGVPFASVARYGLNDSLGPPFREPRRGAIYPFSEGEIERSTDAGRVVRSMPGDCHLRWSPQGTVDGHPDGRWLQVGRAQAAELPALEAWLEPTGPLTLPHVRTASPQIRHRTLWLTWGNSTLVESTPAPTVAAATSDLPADFLQSMVHLYPGTPVYWRLEALATDGTIERASAWSTLPEPVVEMLRRPQKRSPSPRIQ
jgi:hypothetical protein